MVVEREMRERERERASSSVVVVELSGIFVVRFPIEVGLHLDALAFILGRVDVHTSSRITYTGFSSPVFFCSLFLSVLRVYVPLDSRVWITVLVFSYA